MKSRRIAVYRYKSRWPVSEFLPRWGTRDAIASLDGCIPLAKTRREVAPSLLDEDGFVRMEAEQAGF